MDGRRQHPRRRWEQNEFALTVLGALWLPASCHSPSFFDHAPAMIRQLVEATVRVHCMTPSWEHSRSSEGAMLEPPANLRRGRSHSLGRTAIIVGRRASLLSRCVRLDGSVRLLATTKHAQLHGENHPGPFSVLMVLITVLRLRPQLSIPTRII